jgi:hypothetical protein
MINEDSCKQREVAVWGAQELVNEQVAIAEEVEFADYP